MIQLIVLFTLSVWACIQNLLYWGKLPERVAIHFGADGVADNWMDRDGATMLMIGLQVLLPWLMVGIAAATRSLPNSVINIPNRAYWLQPERRQASLAYVAGLMSSIAIAESVLISLVNHLSYVANRTGQPLNTQLLLIILGIFLATVFALVLQLTRRFAMPSSSNALPG